jgi:hypothetical protein
VKEKMKRKMVFFGLLVMLMFVLIVAPAIAKEPTITDIYAIQKGTVTSTEDQWTTNGDIMQKQGVVNEGTVQLFIPNTASTPTYIFKLYNVYSQTNNINSVPNVVFYPPYTIRVDAKWIYSENGVVKGTFEGQINWNINSPGDAHGLLHGTGIFEGQTLKFWEDTSKTGTQWIGTLTVR